MGTARFKRVALGANESLGETAENPAQQFGVTDAVPAARRCADFECFRASRRDRTQEVTKPLLYH
jgi:hypothetical protein